MYFNLLAERFASPPNQSVSFHCLIGGELFELVFAHKKLAFIFEQAFEKVENHDQPSFKVHIWDSVISGKEIVPAGWESSQYLQKGEIAGYESSEYRLVYDIGSQAISMAQLSSGHAYYWTPDLSQIPYWERGSPLRNIIHWFLRLKQKCLSHGAGVGFSTGGAMIVGKGGSGKSTTALSCLSTELKYSGDDYCALGMKGEKPFVYHVYSNAKVGDLDHKQVLHIRDRHPKKILSSFPLKSLLFPQICYRTHPRLVPARKSLILRELAVSTMLQLPGKNREMFPFFSTVVEKVPCFVLELSENYAENAALIKQHIRGRRC